MNFINYNGTIYPANQSLLPITNRSFKFGDGLFESIRMIKGKLMYLDFHLERLFRGMQALGLEANVALVADNIRQMASALLKRNGSYGNARFRLTVFREGEGLYSPLINSSGFSMEMETVADHDYQNNPRGLVVDVYQDITKPVNFLSEFKTCNALPFVMAGHFRKRNSLDDVFLLNTNGFLCETMSSNVFVYYQGKLYTPSIKEGCVAGVMRRVVMELAEDSGYEVIEAQINPDILNLADEVFLTNAVRGIQWVMGFNNKRYFNEVSKNLLDRLNYRILID